jgi:molybdate ABC transporter, permease protein
MPVDLMPFYISIKLAVIVTSILLCVTLPVAWHLSFGRVRARTLVETILSLPMVMPPTVLGFYLLLAFSRATPTGRLLNEVFDIQLAFSFPGIVVASCIYSFPFALQPLKAGFDSLDRSLIEASYTLGKSPLRTFMSVVLPGIAPSVFAAAALCFAHTMGEFGTVLMIGGNIPGVTRVASIALYDKVEQLEYLPAHVYSFTLLVMSFLFLFAFNYTHRRMRIIWEK